MFMNFDHHNRLFRVAGARHGYICNCCNHKVSSNEVYGQDDGSGVICKKCVKGIASLCHMSEESVIYAVEVVKGEEVYC